MYLRLVTVWFCSGSKVLELFPIVFSSILCSRWFCSCEKGNPDDDYGKFQSPCTISYSHWPDVSCTLTRVLILFDCHLLTSITLTLRTLVLYRSILQSTHTPIRIKCLHPCPRQSLDLTVSSQYSPPKPHPIQVRHHRRNHRPHPNGHICLQFADSASRQHPGSHSLPNQSIASANHPSRRPLDVSFQYRWLSVIPILANTDISFARCDDTGARQTPLKVGRDDVKKGCSSQIC